MSKFQQPTVVLKFIIGIGYIVLGILLFIIKQNIYILSGISKLLFAVLLVLYGSFRVYRAIKSENN